MPPLRWVAPTPLASTSTRAPDSASRTAALSPARPVPTTIDVVARLDVRTGSSAATGSGDRAGLEVVDVEQPLEDPVVEPGLAQLVAVEDRPHALPALLEEAAQRSRGPLTVEAADGVQDPGRAVDAEPALARAHPEPQAAPDVVEVERPAPAHRLLEPARARRARTRRSAARPGASPRAAADASRGGNGGRPRCPAGAPCRAARPLHVELRAHRVHDVLGHQPQRRGLAAGDGEKAAHAVAREVVERGVRAGDVAGSRSPPWRPGTAGARRPTRAARAPGGSRGPAARRRRASGRPRPG